MDKNKLVLPISILLGCIILGGFYYASESNIQKQQQAVLQAQTEKNNADEFFNNNLKCQDLLKDLKQRWNNVVGIYYDDIQNTCIVKYTAKDGTVEEAPVGDMQDTSK
jgi:Na+-translocating ferredoxin:NAD+ oxidoreductase RnfG subunit